MAGKTQGGRSVRKKNKSKKWHRKKSEGKSAKRVPPNNGYISRASRVCSLRSEEATQRGREQMARPWREGGRMRGNTVRKATIRIWKTYNEAC